MIKIVLVKVKTSVSVYNSLTKYLQTQIKQHLQTGGIERVVLQRSVVSNNAVHGCVQHRMQFVEDDKETGSGSVRSLHRLPRVLVAVGARIRRVSRARMTVTSYCS